MAKAKEPDIVDENTQLAARGETGLTEIPDWMQGVQEDEPIPQEDVKMPRLAIAQGMSPAMTPGKPEYLEDLKLGQMFNTLTGDIYGKGPIEFAIAKRLPSRWVQFDEDRKMVNPDVDPHDTELTSWRVNQETGERLPPIATKFLDYVIVLLDRMEPIALSCAKSNIKPATALNGLIQMRKPKVIGGKQVRVPEFAMKFTVETAQLPVPGKNSTFGAFVFKNAGDLLSEPEKARAMRVFHDQFATEVIEIDRAAVTHESAEPGDAVEPPDNVGSTDFEPM